MGTDITHPTVFGYFNQPAVIAGIDPQAEAALLGLDQCVTNGQYLPQSGGVGQGPSQPGLAAQPRLQVIASDRSFVDEQIALTVERSFATAPLLNDKGIAAIDDWQPVATLSSSADDAYRTMIPTLQAGFFDSVSSLWTQGDVQYRQVGGDHLAAQPVAQNLDVYLSRSMPQGGLTVPPEARDTWFRQLQAHEQPADYRQPTWELVGQYDPTCLSGFDPLAGYRLETYAAPLVRLPDGSELGPTRNMAGYVNSPPVVLTTLEGAEFLADPKRFAGRPGEAFISAIRVRVSGVEAPSAAAEAKLTRVAADIASATGLDVDIVVGSSPRPMSVDLPAGKYGRPALTVTEGWAVKGVAVRFLESVQAQDIAIFALVLVVAAILVAETAYLSVRRRRKEFGILRALGWSAARVALLVELEMLLLGLTVGLLAALTAAIAAALLRLELPLALLLAAVPVATVTAGIAGAIPAVAASRGTTLRVIRGHGLSNLLGGSTIPCLALGDLLGYRRVEAVLGVVAAGLAAFLVGGIVLIVLGFRGVLDTTLLGNYVSARVQPFHLAIAGLTAVVAMIAVTEVVTMSYLERQVELAALRALGWPRRVVALLLVTQSGSIGIVGGALGALAVVALGLLFSAAVGVILLSAGLGALVIEGMALLAAIGPLAYAQRASPSLALREDL